MRSPVRDFGQRVATAIKAREELAPQENFAEQSLDQFKGVLQRCLDARAKLAAIETQRRNALAERKAADAEGRPALQRFVHAVKAHPRYGEDSGLYTALGYVPASNRSTGLTRRRRKSAERPAEKTSSDAS